MNYAGLPHDLATRDPCQQQRHEPEWEFSSHGKICMLWIYFFRINWVAIFDGDGLQESWPSLQILWPGTEHRTVSPSFPWVCCIMIFPCSLRCSQPAAARKSTQKVDFLNETRPSQRLTSRTCQLDPIGQPPHLWPYPHPATGFVLFGAGWSVCVCAVICLVVFCFLCYGLVWFGFFALVGLGLVWGGQVLR